MQRSPKLLMVCQTAALTMRALEEQAAHETQANSGAFRTRIEFELEFVKAGGMLLRYSRDRHRGVLAGQGVNR